MLDDDRGLMNMMKNYRMLNEDLKSQKLEMYPEMSLANLMTFARFSPDYDLGMEQCKLKFQFDANDLKFSDFQMQIGNLRTIGLIFSIKSVGGQKGQKTLNIDYPQQSFGQLMKAIKSKKMNPPSPKRNGDNISLSGDEFTLKNVYLVWKDLKDGKDTNQTQLLRSGEELPKETLDDFNSRLESPKEMIEIKCHDLGTAISLFVCIEKGFDSFLKIANTKHLSTLDETDVLKSDELKQFYDAITILENISEQTRFIISLGYNEVVRAKKSIQDVLREFREFGVAHNIHKFQMRVSAKATSIAEREKKKAKEENEKLPKNKRKSEDQLDEEAKSKVKKALEQSLSGIMSIKTLEELKKHLAGRSQDDSEEEFQNKLLRSRPNPTNPCAKRRMKLFEDLLASTDTPTPKVYWNDEFVIGLTYTRDQNHIFGRYKPICVAGSITEIDEACNSLSAHGTNRELRDHVTEYDSTGRSRTYVKDGIGADSSPWESNWCTTGATHFSGSQWNKTNTFSYWNNYNQQGKYPYAIIMEVDSGRMYQYAGGIESKMFLFEDEHKSNISKWYRNLSDYISNMRRFRDSYPTLDEMMREVEKEYSGIGSASGGEIEIARKFASSHNMVTDNNRIIIKDGYSLNKVKSIISDFDGIVIGNNIADSLFQDFEIVEDLPPIDCARVTSAKSMFFNAKISGTLTLKNTSSIRDMKSMFRGCRITNIVGLDASGATDITEMFYDASAQNLTRFMSFPELKLRNCTNADFAFTHCSSRKITLSLTDKITTAKDMFLNCYALNQMPAYTRKGKDGKIEKTFPNLPLQNICTSITDVREATESDASKIFDGCSTLHADEKFNSQCKEIYEVYFKSEDSKVEELTNTDDRGFLVINSMQDVKDNISKMHRYPGVVVNLEDATELFSQNCITAPIRIQALDVSKVKIATKMFYGAKILRLGKFIGLDKVQKADYMFMRCKCNQYPELDFSGLRGEFKVFYESYASRESKLPKVKVGADVDLEMPNESDIRREYPNAGDEAIAQHLADAASRCARSILHNTYGSNSPESYGYEGWIATHHPTRVGSWYLGLGKMSHEAFLEKAKNLEKTEEGYVKFSSAKFFKRYIGNDDNTVRKIFEELKGIYVDSIDATGFFEDIHLPDDMPVPPINLERVQDATEMFMNFNGRISKLEKADNIQVANRMFSNANLVEIPKFNTKTITSGEDMFSRIVCSSEYPEEMCDLRSLTNGSHMFMYSRFAKNIDFSKFNLQSLTTGTQMFYNLKSGLKVESIHLQRCITCNSMFRETPIELQNGLLREVDLPVATNVDLMFLMSSGTGTSSKILKIGRFFAPLAISAKKVFFHNNSLKLISELDIHHASSINEIFMECSSLKCIVPIKTKFPPGRYFDAHKAFKDCPLHVIYGNNAEKIKARNVALGL